MQPRYSNLPFRLYHLPSTFIPSFPFSSCDPLLSFSMPSSVTSSSSSSSSTITHIKSPKKFTVPDLVSHCTFNVRINRHRKQVTSATKQWLFKGDNLLIGKKRDAYHGLKAGLLTAMCYPDAGRPQLRVCNDFLTYLFHLDNLSDDMDNGGTISTADVVLNSLYHPFTFQSSARVGKMTREYVDPYFSSMSALILSQPLLSFYKRMVLTCSPGVQQRFIETFDFFFQSVTQQAIDRANGSIPDLESYIALRRDTSGCKPCWALIECTIPFSHPLIVSLTSALDANNFDIPDEVMEDPIIRSLGEAANDLVTWSNVRFILPIVPHVLMYHSGYLLL